MIVRSSFPIRRQLRRYMSKTECVGLVFHSTYLSLCLHSLPRVPSTSIDPSLPKSLRQTLEEFRKPLPLDRQTGAGREQLEAVSVIGWRTVAAWPKELKPRNSLNNVRRPFYLPSLPPSTSSFPRLSTSESSLEYVGGLTLDQHSHPLLKAGHRHLNLTGS